MIVEGDFMLKRKMTKQLIEWKNNHKNNCLLVIGARQVGKTFIIKEFAKENYESIIYMNFIENEDYKNIFKSNLDVESIIKQITLRIPNVTIVPHKTILVLDEIQACENAITALKFLAQDSRFDCIASGSLLGIAYKRVSSFPVGYVERLEMNSLDFEEFCWANGMDEDAISYLKEFYDKKETVPDSIHKRMMDLFKEYIVVGGMPRIVDEFVTTHNFGSVLKLQKNIIEDYNDDIVKYADETDKAKIRDCFHSIPKHLARENKKFRYSLVDKNGTSKKYFGALEWLYDAGIINFCHNLSALEAPLEGYAKDDVFKVYMKDTGLLMAMLEEGSQIEIIDGNLGIYKGAIYENIIADILNKLGKKLYYFEHNSTLEVDFVIRYYNKVTAIEVKSADNTKSKSLNSLMQNWGLEQGIRLSSKNIGSTQDKIICLPLYMSMFL